MACLSKNGYELLRLSKANDRTPTEKFDTVIWEKTAISYRSNRQVMKQEAVKFAAGPCDNGKPRHHNYGWKRWRSIKRDRDMFDVAAQHAQSMSARGWNVDYMAPEVRVRFDALPPLQTEAAA